MAIMTALDLFCAATAMHQEQRDPEEFRIKYAELSAARVVPKGMVGGAVPVTLEEVETALRTKEEVARKALTLEDVEVALAKVDVPTMEDEEDRQVTWEVWDGEGFNGATGARIRELYAASIIPGQPVYLLRKNGRVVQVQPHAPHVQGIHPCTEAHAVQLKTDRVEGAVNDRLVQVVLKEGLLAPVKGVT